MMKKIKEVTVFTIGDSGKINTWSNVPFFLTETLIAKGIKVNRVNIDSGLPFYHQIIHYFAKIFNRATTYGYFRSFTHYNFVRKRIKKAVKQYVNSDLDIFTTFSFSSIGITPNPVILLCDWTYDYYIKYFKNRKPDFFEKTSIHRENEQIRKANLVFSLFPHVTEYMKAYYKNNHIFYLGNVVNSLYQASEETIQTKKENFNLLFIGSNKYIEGVKTLIEAFKNLKQHYPQLLLHIIGIDNQEFENLPDDIFCYGYLDKGVDIERDLYYRLIQQATIFINTTPKWGAFSASIEAMYFYTPIIVTPYKGFLETFGENINFGCYCEENVSTKIESKIIEILTHSNYAELCIQAHHAVKDFTWDAFVDNMITQIESSAENLLLSRRGD